MNTRTPWRHHAVSPQVILLVACLAVLTALGQQPGWAQERKVTLVPVGEFSGLALKTPIDLPALAAYYKRWTGITVGVASPVALEPRVFDPRRNQYVAEDLIELMKRRLPRLARDPSMILIGITPHDMYTRRYDWVFAFTYRLEGRFAIISTARLEPVNFGQAPNPALFHSRLRKLITRNFGLLYYGLDFNNNPNSVMYEHLLGIEELDRMTESW